MLGKRTKLGFVLCVIFSSIISTSGFSRNMSPEEAGLSPIEISEEGQVALVIDAIKQAIQMQRIDMVSYHLSSDFREGGGIAGVDAAKEALEKFFGGSKAWGENHGFELKEPGHRLSPTWDFEIGIQNILVNGKSATAHCNLFFWLEEERSKTDTDTKVGADLIFKKDKGRWELVSTVNFFVFLDRYGKKEPSYKEDKVGSRQKDFLRKGDQ